MGAYPHPLLESVSLGTLKIAPFSRTPSSTQSRDCVYNDVLELCLPCEVGEVSPARCWLVTEGSVFVSGDPSVSRTKKLCSSHLPY